MSEKLNIFLKKVKEKMGKLPDDLHVTRKAGALVAISDGKVILVGKPTVRHCPLFRSLFGTEDVSQDSIKEKFNRQFENWGMFTCDRVLVGDKIVVPFGASEMMMYALRRNIVDAAVLVCEGAGTVITSNPGLVQGIGAYMNGVFYTSPVQKIIDRIIENDGSILDAENASIDQYEGVKTAVSPGFKKIVVTVRGDQEDTIKKIREFEDNNKESIEITILSVCNTGINEKQAYAVKKYSDIAWACASRQIWETIGSSAILQLGMKIPVFVLTVKGIDFISGYSKDEKLKNIDFKKKHYITANRFEQGGIKMDLGRFNVYLYETGRLPIHTTDEPEPLN